jgi:hypothetical protein
MSLQIREILVKAYVWSIVLYGSEMWIIGDGERRRLKRSKSGGIGEDEGKLGGQSDKR